MARRKGPTPQRPWQPLEEHELAAAYVAALRETGVDPRTVRIWSNDLYEVTGHAYAPGQVHLSIKRLDRKPIMDWRHLQQIKNETCGDEAEAVQVFPDESRLVDEANQYHLYVMIPGFGLEGREGVLIRARNVDGHVWLEVGIHKREVGTQADMDAALGTTDHKGRQRPWQPGLTTGQPIDPQP
jgi:hypothetical protein